MIRAPSLSTPDRSFPPRRTVGVDTWEAEGGSSLQTGETSAPGDWSPSVSERRLLQSLGVALLGEWNDLPKHLQRALFDQASAVEPAARIDGVRSQLARFLHDRKDDAASR